ncbi:hypothetical protein JTB14_033294 [Gonioctena quinquepunctata]|nr:hypothetical protein JTB14_033294 [Gonioctena quinquepunctata]
MPLSTKRSQERPIPDRTYDTVPMQKHENNTGLLGGGFNYSYDTPLSKMKVTLTLYSRQIGPNKDEKRIRGISITVTLRHCREGRSHGRSTPHRSFSTEKNKEYWATGNFNHNYVTPLSRRNIARTLYSTQIVLNKEKLLRILGYGEF